MPESTEQGYQVGAHALIAIYCSAGHLVGTWVDTIEEKYPFWCEQCGEYARDGKYPWRLVTDIVTGFFTPAGVFVAAPAVESIPTDDQLAGG